MKIGIWINDKLVYEQEVENEEEARDLEKNIEVMVSEDDKNWRYINSIKECQYCGTRNKKDAKVMVHVCPECGDEFETTGVSCDGRMCRDCGGREEIPIDNY